MSFDIHSSRALHYGHGCFTTLVYRDGEPVLWDYHWQRLQRSCSVLGLSCDELIIKEQLRVSISQQNRQVGVLKILVVADDAALGYRSPGGLNTSVLFFPRPVELQWLIQKREQGCRLICCQYRLAHQPRLAGIKHLNRLDQVMASQELSGSAIPDGTPATYDDGVMLDVDDYVIETTCANIFLCVDGQWLTPDLSFAGVAGVARAFIIDWFKDSGQSLSIRKIHWSEFSQAQEIFICNSVRGIWPVVGVQDNNCVQEKNCVQDKSLVMGEWTRYLQKKTRPYFL